MQADTFMGSYRAGGLELKDFELDVQSILAAAEQEAANKRKKTLEREESRKHPREAAAAGVFDDGPDDFQVHFRHRTFPHSLALSWVKRNPDLCMNFEFP